MKNLGRIACITSVLFVLGCALQLERADAQAMTKSQLQSLYMEYLRQQGYPAEIDSDGDILFRAEGRSYYIIVNDTDLEYFELLYPNFWEIESDEEWIRVAAACSAVSRTTKIAKVYITSNNDTSIIADVLLLNPKDFANVFPRMMNIVRLARDKFLEQMRQ
jgi:outer membrane lipoprotein-sorting protein